MSKRVKEADPQIEAAYRFSDAIDAVRQPLHSGLRLGDLIDGLRAARQDASVEFDFGGLKPKGVDSYRGYYSDLALSWDSVGLDVARLLKVLEAADGEVFTGYKGGDYRMDRSTPVWVANYGQCHGVAVVRVDNQDWRVVLHTALID